MSATKANPAKKTSKQIGGYFLGEDRDLRLFIRVNKKEKDRFLKLAKARHTDISELVRQILHREADSILLKEAS